MKGAIAKILIVAVVMLALVVPVSADTAGSSPGGANNPAAPVVPILENWYEDWDSYPTGQNMHGIGGWKGWYNDPNATAYTTDVQAITTPNSIDINGASDLVHEYAIDDGVWTYTAWQYIPTGFADETYFILLNQYDDAGLTTNWSTQVRFDGNDGLVVFQGYYEDLAQLPLITGEWVELRVEIDLVNDWQQFYYGGDLLYEADWSNGIGSPTPGITSIGAVDLYANLASSVYYDDLSLVEVPEAKVFATHVRIIKLPSRPLLLGLVRIVNNDFLPVGGATVDVEWTLPLGGGYVIPQSRTTNANGLAFPVMVVPVPGTYALDLINVTAEGYVYDPGMNQESGDTWTTP